MATESEFKADLEEHVLETFFNHPQCGTGDDGKPTIPATALVEVFRQISEEFDNVELMTPEEEGQLTALVDANPGMEVPPDLILAFIANRAEASSAAASTSELDLIDDPDSSSISQRGRYPERRRSRGGYSRDSSQDSAYGQGVFDSRPSSRAGSIVHSTPQSSAFDKRQRTAPLTAPPSSWSKPAPARRRRSIGGGGNQSDSESGSAGFRQSLRRGGPSNPSTPGFGNLSDPFLPTDLYNSGSRPTSRPASRAHSRANSRQGLYGSPENSFDYHSQNDFSMDASLSSVPLPSRHLSRHGSDEEEEDMDGDDDRGPIWHGRALSNASIEDESLLQALKSANAELSKKLKESEDTLERRLAEHEEELAELTSHMEDLKNELNSARREEKELRAKDRTNQSQITAIEGELSRVQKQLDGARNQYQTLNKLYQDQCAEAERYRNQLRMRDTEIKDLQDQASITAIDVQKMQREQDTYEDRIAILEDALEAAHMAHTQLDEQKGENILLKETIDKLRFEMDELRNNAIGGVGVGSEPGMSRNASLKRTLGEELARGLRDVSDAEETTQKTKGDEAREEEIDDGADTEGEEVVRTVFTRRRKKVGNRANIDTSFFEDSKEYADAYSQYDRSEFATSSSVQTDAPPEIRRRSAFAQTAVATTQAASTQTEDRPIPLERVTTEMDIQTEPVEVKPISPVKKHKNKAASLATADLPPAYEPSPLSTTAEQREAVLASTHPGLATALPELSLDTRAEWDALKAELGVGCAVIDRVLAQAGSTHKDTAAAEAARKRQRNKFYNVYNTYVYGSDAQASGISPLMHTLIYAGVTAAILLYVTGHIAPIPQYDIPGGPSYYDRLAWSGFNGMQAAGEGFGGADGTAVIWNLFGRLGGGAARHLRGWPT